MRGLLTYVMFRPIPSISSDYIWIGDSVSFICRGTGFGLLTYVMFRPIPSISSDYIWNGDTVSFICRGTGFVCIIT